MSEGWVSGLVAFAVSAALCPVVLVVLRRHRILDVPTERSSHASPTPRGGGIAVAVGAVAGGLLAPGPTEMRTGLLLAGAVLAAIGLAEDVVGIPVVHRFGPQLVVGGVIAPLLLRGSGLGGVAAGLAAVGVVAWVAAFVNAFNFMDGINGISAAEAVLAGGTYAWMGRSHHALLVAGGLAAVGAALGFLPFNFPRARVFLGDVGSYFLGAWLAVLAIIAIRAHLGAVAVGAPLALYVGDTGVTLFSRIIRRENWREPHRDHAYQRLVRAGWSHLATTALVWVIVATCCVLGANSRGRKVVVQAAFCLGIAVLVGTYLAGANYLARQHAKTA